MRDKHPPGRGNLVPYVQQAGDSGVVGLSFTRRLVRHIDTVVGTGPRGLHGGHLLALHDTDIHFKGSDNGAPLGAFRKPGEAVDSGEAPRVVAPLSVGMLTPLLLKKAT